MGSQTRSGSESGTDRPRRVLENTLRLLTVRKHTQRCVGKEETGQIHEHDSFPKKRAPFRDQRVVSFLNAACLVSVHSPPCVRVAGRRHALVRSPFSRNRGCEPPSARQLPAGAVLGGPAASLRGVRLG